MTGALPFRLLAHWLLKAIAFFAEKRKKARHCCRAFLLLRISPRFPG
jgi:hypothetical protein